MSIKKILARALKERCAACKGKTELNCYGFCSRCFRDLTFIANLHESEQQHIFRYEGHIKKIISDFKYGRKRFYGKKLAKTAAAFLQKEDVPEFRYIIPVPLHWKKEFTRGFNQSAVIAAYLGKMTDKKILFNILVKIRNTRSQTEMDGTGRKTNVKDSFRVKNGRFIKNSSVLLLDDVYTTGATVNEARKVLLKAGAEKVIVLTIAKA